MRNFEKFKTAEERAKAFEKFCNVHDKCDCSGCPLSEIKPDCGQSRGQFAWLDLEAEEEEKPLPCPFCGGEVKFKHMVGGYSYVCECGYCATFSEFKSEAIAAHNRVARAVMKEKEGDQ